MQSKKIGSYFSCMPSQEWFDVLIVPDAPEVITEAGDSSTVQLPFDLQRVFLVVLSMKAAFQTALSTHERRIVLLL